MTFLPISQRDREEMLDALGAHDVAELWSTIPPELELRRPLKLPPRLTELEAVRELGRLAAKNASAVTHASFLGAGAYDHYVPSAVHHLLLRSEFYTAYTPYQPEVAQGTLQAIYEYQTLICELTGMEVANASVYDGASALAEASIMAAALTRRSRLVLSDGIHPGYREVVATYHRGPRRPIEVTPLAVSGRTDLAELERRVRDDTAAVLLQSPNFFGVVEDVAAAAEIVHAAGGLLVVCAEPFSLGVLEAPGRLDADVVVGEGQGLGNALSLGGPYLGFLATRRRFIRQMPGRIIGRSVDSEGQTAYVMVLQTREQHIRREKATSNICTNQGLNALAATIYLSLVGRDGFLQAARASFQKAHYAAARIAALPGYELAFDAPFFNEFAVRTPLAPRAICRAGLEAGLFPGLPLDDYPLRDGFHSPAVDAGRTLLVAVTEKRTREELDRLVELLGRLGGDRARWHGGGARRGGPDDGGRAPRRGAGARRRHASAQPRHLNGSGERMPLLEYHGHACFVVESAAGRVIFDPFLTGNPRADVGPENVGQVDAILVSHGHADHFGDTVAIARQHRATVVAAFEIASWCEKQGLTVHAMATGGAHEFPFGWVKLVPAAHGSLFEADPAFSTNPVGLLYRAEGRLVYHMGDTALTADVKLLGELHRVDLLLAPIGDNFTMGPEDALKAVEFLRPELVVPMHYDTWDVIEQDARAFQREVQRAGASRCEVLEPGETLQF